MNIKQVVHASKFHPMVTEIPSFANGSMSEHPTKISQNHLTEHGWYLPGTRAPLQCQQILASGFESAASRSGVTTNRTSKSTTNLI